MEEMKYMDLKIRSINLKVVVHKKDKRYFCIFLLLLLVPVGRYSIITVSRNFRMKYFLFSNEIFISANRICSRKYWQALRNLR